MRWLAASLFVVGLPWALIAFIGVGAPLAGLGGRAQDTRREDERRFETTMSSKPTPTPADPTPVEDVRRVESRSGNVGLAWLMCIQSITGYAIWWRWLLIATGHRRTSRSFWSLAAIHHFFWLPVFLDSYRDGYLLFQAIVWYSVALAITCVVAAVAGRTASAARPGFA